MTAAENAPTVGHLDLVLFNVDKLPRDEALEIRRRELASAIDLLAWRAQQEGRGIEGADKGFNEVLDYTRAIATAIGELKNSSDDQTFDRTRSLRLVSSAAIATPDHEVTDLTALPAEQ